MAQIKFKGNPINTCGELPKVGTKAPDFLLTRTDLSDFSLADVAGKMVLMNIFPSIDTSVCSMSVRTFNTRITQFFKTVLLSISLDLPFAHKRFCETEGIENAISASELRNRKFGDDYGLRITDGPLAGLLARAVIVLDEAGTVRYTQLVPDIAQEPDYEEALNALKTAATETDSCTYTETAEHARTFSSDEPCDDGRSG